MDCAKEEPPALRPSYFLGFLPCKTEIGKWVLQVSCFLSVSQCCSPVGVLTYDDVILLLTMASSTLHLKSGISCLQNLLRCTKATLASPSSASGRRWCERCLDTSNTVPGHSYSLYGWYRLGQRKRSAAGGGKLLGYLFTRPGRGTVVSKHC
jgi:hypothetical protein